MTRLNTAAFMTALLLATSACSDGLLPDGERSIVGEWLMIVPESPDGDPRSKLYLDFGRDGTFVLKIVFEGFAAGFTPHCLGDYRMDGNKLMLRREVCYDVNLTPTYPSEPEWEDTGSVWLSGAYLKLTGNGPEPRTTIYRRDETLQPD